MLVPLHSPWFRAGMRLRTHLLLLLSLVTLAALSPARGETVTLVATSTVAVQDAFSETVTLAAGDVAEVKYASPVNAPTLRVVIATKSFDLTPLPLGGSAPLCNPVIAGPATLRAVVNASVGTTHLVTLAITRGGAQATPAAPVVVPENANHSVRILVEASTDLITWTDATPGLYASNTVRRFFRIRGVVEP